MFELKFQFAMSAEWFSHQKPDFVWFCYRRAARTFLPLTMLAGVAFNDVRIKHSFSRKKKVLLRECVENRTYNIGLFNFTERAK
jgi:hypothetical protein